MYNIFIFALPILYCSAIVINSESGSHSEIVNNGTDLIENVTFSTGNITLLVDKNPDSFKQVLQFVKQFTMKSTINWSLATFNSSGNYLILLLKCYAYYVNTFRCFYKLEK